LPTTIDQLTTLSSVSTAGFLLPAINQLTTIFSFTTLGFLLAAINQFHNIQLTTSGFLLPVWRIQDVYPGSRILIFTHPGSWIPDPKTATKERGEKN
jgi:hypothetical protein